MSAPPALAVGGAFAFYWAVPLAYGGFRLLMYVANASWSLRRASPSLLLRQAEGYPLAC